MDCLEGGGCSEVGLLFGVDLYCFCGWVLWMMLCGFVLVNGDDRSEDVVFGVGCHFGVLAGDVLLLGDGVVELEFELGRL